MEANCIPWNPFVAAIHDRREDSPQKQVNTILIVEEHPVVYYQFQQRSLSQFPVSFSPSGAAVARACEEQPKLVVLHTDHNSALELNRKFKANRQIDDIPVMVLGQYPDEEKRREAFMAGVDEYWSAPLNVDDFIIRAHNLIQIRQLLREKFCQSSDATLTIPPTRDEKFLQDAMHAIERWMSDPHFSVTTLARETGVSLTQLYRKCMMLTGHSPNDLIRQHRLSRATDLLRTHRGNVSEVAYQVGFRNLSYFTKCFKGQFNCLPSMYARQSA